MTAKPDKPDAATLVTFLLDRSGSMGSVKGDTIAAFNSYLDGLKAEPTGIRFSLLFFDTNGVPVIYRDVRVEHAAPLTADTYRPEHGGGTPLIDAAMKTIKATEAKAKHGDKVVVCIQTDGHENASREHTWADLALAVKEKTKLGWEFLFLGCNMDAYDQGARMGIAAANTVSYAQDAASTNAVFAATAMNTASYARGMSANVGYSSAQKLASGDVFDPFGNPILPGVPTGPAATPAHITDALAKSGSTPITPDLAALAEPPAGARDLSINAETGRFGFEPIVDDIDL